MAHGVRENMYYAPRIYRPSCNQVFGSLDFTITNEHSSLLQPMNIYREITVRYTRCEVYLNISVIQNKSERRHKHTCTYRPTHTQKHKQTQTLAHAQLHTHIHFMNITYALTLHTNMNVTGVGQLTVHAVISSNSIINIIHNVLSC